METLGVDATTGRLEHVVFLPHPSYLPLISGLLTAGAVLSMLFKVYGLAALFALLTVASFILWSQRNAIARDLGALDVGRGQAVPPHTEVARPAAWWAAVFGIAVDATLFASLVFGSLYLWLIAPNWPPPAVAQRGAIAYAVLVGFVLLWIARRWLESATARERPLAALTAIMLLCSLLMALLGVAINALPDPRQHAHLATVLALLLYAAVHAGVGLVLAFNLALKVLRGLISARSSLDVRVVGRWLDYIAISGIAAVGMVLLMPALIDMLGQTP